MNQKHLQFICIKLQLGSPEEKMERIYGGRGGHFLWRVTTEKGSYCIKQLASDIDLKNEKISAKYELNFKPMDYAKQLLHIPSAAIMKFAQW